MGYIISFHLLTTSVTRLTPNKVWAFGGMTITTIGYLWLVFTCEPGEVASYQDDARSLAWGGASYDTSLPSYTDDGTCFDVPEWCWADGQDTF